MKHFASPRGAGLKRDAAGSKKTKTARQHQISKSEKSRDLILEAAAKLFRRQGYSATTLRQIAAMAEIKAGSIYYYFDSKEAILDEVLHRGLLGVFDAVKTALKRAGKVSHRRRIGLAIEAHLVALLEASDFTSANIRIYGQLPEHLRSRTGRCGGPMRDTGTGCFWTRGVPAKFAPISRSSRCGYSCWAR